MFILRTVHNPHKVDNKVMGSQYSIHRKSDISEEEWSRATKEMPEHLNDKLFGFISYDGGKLICLLNGKDYYIMTENGNTFEIISQ